MCCTLWGNVSVACLQKGAGSLQAAGAATACRRLLPAALEKSLPATGTSAARTVFKSTSQKYSTLGSTSQVSQRLFWKIACLSMGSTYIRVYTDTRKDIGTCMHMYVCRYHRTYLVGVCSSCLQNPWEVNFLPGKQPEEHAVLWTGHLIFQAPLNVLLLI